MQRDFSEGDANEEIGRPNLKDVLPPLFGPAQAAAPGNVKRASQFAIAMALAALAMGCGSPSPRPTPSPGQEGRPFEVGGSNYVMYSVGEYVTDPRDEIWVRDVRPVIGTYHLDPATVKQQLLTMFANGQRRLSLVLWFTDLSPFAAIAMNETYGHSVNSRLGRLLPTQEANLRSVLRLIREDGYLEVIFRFATQDGSAPWEWSEWNEGAYLKNLSFIATTRDIVEQELGASPVAVTYDLDAELGGRVDGQSRPYLVRLWGDYARRFGTTRTVALSVVASPGRFSQLIRDLNQTGLRPPEYAVDVYGDEASRLAFVGEELRAANEGGKPLIVRFPRSAPSSSGRWSGAWPRTTSRSTIPSGSRITSPSSSEGGGTRRRGGAPCTIRTCDLQIRSSQLRRG